MRLLDLFCGAGGAAMGYHRAGFEVVGVDIKPQPRYPFRFVQADALGMPLLWAEGWLTGFDAIHASPPCQFATLLKHAPGGRDHLNLIPATRAVLQGSGLPYVIENVEPARPHLVDPTLLCGSMFGLGAQAHELRRHRLFETTFPLSAPRACSHSTGPVIGVYGGHARRRSSLHGGRGTRDVWEGGHRGAASEALGMDWATLAEMSEAIPPAYSEYVGSQLMAYLELVPENDGKAA